ncbi:MAG TPA: hypothetical protein VGO31_09610 [Microbacteriaceae bacterium]|jgi:hypothetical protein|nr:hypothetical protein [Microbacteriaceae bacterium]
MLGRFESFTTIWLISLTLFDVHLLVTGYLAYRSRSVTRVVSTSGDAAL